MLPYPATTDPPIPPSCSSWPSFADALETKKPFTIQVANERLHIPADAVFNIEHERSGGTDELEFQLRWRPST